jgi:hypothetical protein
MLGISGLPSNKFRDLQCSRTRLQRVSACRSQPDSRHRAKLVDLASARPLKTSLQHDEGISTKLEWNP